MTGANMVFVTLVTSATFF